jgi:starvation-inducible DNA-binding protein
METVTQPNPLKHAEKAMYNGGTGPTGLSQEYSVTIAEKLNALLSGVQVFYANVRAYHWKVSGKQFFTLHDKFEEMYTDLSIKADEIAERVLSLHRSPSHKLSDFVSKSAIPETEGPSDATEIASEVMQSLSSLIEQERKIVSLAEENADFTTADQFTAYISEQEKLLWMFTAFRG